MYEVAKRLFETFFDCIDKPKPYVKNSNDFILKIKSLKVPKGYKIVSLDVKSLFTNVGKKLVIKFLEKRASQRNAKSQVPFSEIIAAIDLLFDNFFFQFDNEFYVQIFGTPMGSPISGLFAVMVMKDLKLGCLRKLSFSPLFFFQYIDDIITCIPDDQVSSILNVFNSYDVRLQFTHEIESNNRISFLDILIIRNNDYLETDL